MKKSNAELVSMVTTRGTLSVNCGDDETYTADANGIFRIPRHHVDDARAHGLVVEGETVVIAKRTSREAINTLQAENDRLKAELVKKTGTATVPPASAAGTTPNSANK